MVRVCGACNIFTRTCAPRCSRIHYLNSSTSKNRLTWKPASHQSRVHFFDISTSKSAPRLKCFDHFHLQIFFALQWRAILDLSLLWPAYFSSLRGHKHWKNTALRDFSTSSRDRRLPHVSPTLDVLGRIHLSPTLVSHSGFLGSHVQYN